MTTETLSKIKHRNLSDNALIYLQTRPGQQFTNQALGRAMGVDLLKMRSTLEVLLKTRKLSANVDVHPKTYYVPTAAQIAERDRPVEVRAFKPYRVPSLMTERMAEIRAHREVHPSFYGSDNQARKA